MNTTLQQFRRQKRDLLQLYPDAKFQMVIESPGSSPVIIPSLDLPTNIAPGLHKIQVSVINKGAKDPQVVMAGTLSVPARDNDHEEDNDSQPQALTLDKIIQQIQSIESYRYNQMREADKILASAQFESIRLYHEARDKQYQDWIERLQRERDEIRAQEEERRKRDLEWQEKLHAQQLEIERLRAGQPAQSTLTPELQNAIAQAAMQLVSVATQIGAAIAMRKFGIPINTSDAVDNTPPPPPGG
jgi:chromosome segregation ATPase